jgi:carboxyl-terminal processing protease
MIGGVYGPGLSKAFAASSASSDDDIRASQKQFSGVLSLVEENFAEKVNADKSIYKGAIPGMLRTLDPHSSFFDPKDFEQLREDQRGHYYGVGMTVANRNGRTIVITPFPGSPAYKAGIRPGDAILEVSGKRTDNLNTTEVAELLKGPRHTEVQIVVARQGIENPINFAVIRDEISRKSVEDIFWVAPGVAYLDIQQFNENTSQEMEQNLKLLGEQNIKGLVLDLRENPGGLLNEGVAVAGHFLNKHQVVVSHRGRTSAEKPYVASHSGKAPEYPIVVLVNRYSASAAEIVAGALQDHDRAWILGDNTFGKGLVQTVYPLSDNAGLALTTAKYYTPSGRSIQRDYTHTSFFNYYYRKDLDTKNPLDVQKTDSGRTVYGGGGISPDEKWAAPKYNQFQVEILRKYAFFDFTAKYFGKRDTRLQKGWAPDQDILNQFHRYLLDEHVPFSEAEWSDNLSWTKQQLQHEVYTTAFGTEAARRLGVENDPEVKRAVESMNKARALVESVSRQMAQRAHLRNAQ